MDWDDLRVFLAVARTGRVARAARHLAVEHSTVVRRIASLEQALGARLFYRTAAGYQPTPHGVATIANAEAMERAALSIDERTRTDPTSGRVRVAMVEELAARWFAPLVPRIRERHPELEVEVLTGEAPLDLSRGESEIAIRWPRPRQRELAAVKLATLRTRLYAHRSRRRRRIDGSARDLVLLVYASRFHDGLQRAPWFQPVMASSKIALVSNNTETLVAAVRANAGIAVLPRFVAEQHSDLVEVSDDLAVNDMWLVTHPEYRRDPKVRALVEIMRNAATTLV